MTKLTALTATHNDDDTLTLAAPKIGRFTAKVAEGDPITEAQTLGWLWVLHQRYEVVSPVSGVVTHLLASHREHPTPYGAALLAYQVEGAFGASRVAPRKAADANLLADLPPGAALFRAPMDGQFYRRPTPESPPFVEPGQVVEPGQTVGLIEVMKFFYPIKNEEKSPKKVERILVGESASVQAGQPLLIWI